MADQSKEIVACGHFTIKTKLNKLNIPTFGKNKKGTSRSVTWLVNYLSNAVTVKTCDFFILIDVSCCVREWLDACCGAEWSCCCLLEEAVALNAVGLKAEPESGQQVYLEIGVFQTPPNPARFIWGCLKILLTCLSAPLSLSSTGGGGGGGVSERRKKCLLKWESCCWSSALRSALIDWLFYDFSTIKFLTLARYSFMLQGPREKCRFVKIISLKWIRNIYFP